jgi:hypothetical protein
MKSLAHMLLAAAFGVIPLLRGQVAEAAQYTDTTFSYSFTYPDTWQTYADPLHPGAVVVRNFPDDQYLQGGNVPFGGTEIVINVFPPYPPDWPSDTDEYARLHADAARIGTILSETNRASGAPARVKFTRQTASTTTNTCVSVVQRLRGRVFDISMQYQSADPAGPQYEQALSDLVASLSIPISGATPSAAVTP